MFLVLFYLQNLPQRGDKFSSIHINVNYNLIKDIRLRQILILNYIATDKLKDYDIYAIVGEISTIGTEKTPPESVAMQHRCNGDIDIKKDIDIELDVDSKKTVTGLI